MEDMLKIVKQKYKADPRKHFGEYEDAMFERVVTLLLQEVPESLGVYVGRIMAKAMAYGDFCGWDSTQEDAEAFVSQFLHGFRAGLVMDEKPESFPERATVIAAFEAVVGQARQAIGLELLTY